MGRSRPREAIATRRRRGAVLAWLAALTVTVLAVTPLGTIVHQISARHAVCEHGELVESGHGGFSPDEAAATRDTAASKTGIREETNVASHGHDHCSVGTLSKNYVAVLPCGDVAGILCDVAVAHVRRDEVAHVRTLLLSAPKTSPPHVAS